MRVCAPCSFNFTIDPAPSLGSCEVCLTNAVRVYAVVGSTNYPSSPNRPEPPPKPSDDVAVWDLVITDMKERDAIGTAKYGTRLHVDDGRDALVDAYQEVLDLAVYLRKEIERRRRITAMIVDDLKTAKTSE